MWTGCKVVGWSSGWVVISGVAAAGVVKWDGV